MISKGGFKRLIEENVRSSDDEFLAKLQNFSQTESFISRNVITDSTYARFSHKRENMHVYSNNKHHKVIIVTKDKERMATWKSDDRGVLRFYGETSSSYAEPIDISRDGTRWEGPGMNSNPCGYGSWMDENDNCLFEGFMVGKREYFVGKKYYEDMPDIGPEYEGFLFEGKKYGKGKQMDRHGNVDYDGYFHDGKSFNPEKINPPFISSKIKEICMTDGNIGNPQMTQLHFPKWLNQLQKIHIGNNCFEHVRYLSIDGPPELTELIIGEQGQGGEEEDYVGELTCCIRNCEKLKYIEFGSNSKKKYKALKLSNLSSLEDFSLRSNSFSVATYLSIQNCNQLKRINIGENCFNGLLLDCSESVDGMNELY